MLTSPHAHLASRTPGLMDRLLQRRDDVLDGWRRGLGPDAALLRRSSDGSDPMLHVVDALLADLERSTGDPMIAPETVFAAAVHGSTRRLQAIGMDVVLHEFDVLRHAMNAVLRAISPTPAPPELVARLDFVVTTASLASLRGYHRDEFDALGQWPSTLNDLLRAEDPWKDVKDTTTPRG